MSLTFLFPAPWMVAVLGQSLGRHMLSLLSLAAKRPGSLALLDQDPDGFGVPTAPGWVVVVGDDPSEPEPALGPAGFHSASLAALLEAADDVSLISCEVKPEIYERASALAAIGLSSIVIETRPAQELMWVAFVEARAPGKLRTIARIDPNRGAAR